jgi:hypothetical protein
MRRAVRFRSPFCTPQLNMESRDVRVCRNEIDSALNATGIGMYLVAYVAPGIDDRLAARIAYTSGVDTVPLSTFSVRRLRRGGLVLGYSAYDAKSIRAATKQLCDALSNVASGPARNRFH